MAKPKTGTLTKIYISDIEYPTEDDLDLIMYTESIPALEDAAEAITYQTTDMESEEQAKSTKKATTIEISVLYHATQHASLYEKSESDGTYNFFVIYPEATANDEGEVLVKSFTAQMCLTGDEITVDDIIKDKLTLYRNSKVTESWGLPTAPTE